MSLLFCLSLMGMTLQGLSPNNFEHPVPLSDYVTLTLGSDRDTYYVGEMLRISLTATNVSDVPITAILNLCPKNMLVEVFFRRAGGDFTRLTDLPWKRRGDKAHWETLRPGETYTAEDKLSVTILSKKPTAFLLAEPGTYEFWVRYTDTTPLDLNSILESDVLTVNVIEPPGHEAPAFADYTPDLAYVAQCDRVRSYLSPQVVHASAEFIDRHSDSRYAPPVKAGLLLWVEGRVLQGVATQEEKDLYESLFQSQDSAAPLLTVTTSPSTLWPPNHKLIPVSATIDVSDDTDPNPEIALVSITCDDGCDPALDVGDTLFGTDDREFSLRAERSGGGDGRTYTITYSATDASGNEATASTTVVVPHDQGKKKGKK